jgi:hypothetical protein
MWTNGRGGDWQGVRTQLCGESGVRVRSGGGTGENEGSSMLSKTKRGIEVQCRGIAGMHDGFEVRFELLMGFIKSREDSCKIRMRNWDDVMRESIGEDVSDGSESGQEALIGLVDFVKMAEESPWCFLSVLVAIEWREGQGKGVKGSNGWNI